MKRVLAAATPALFGMVLMSSSVNAVGQSVRDARDMSMQACRELMNRMDRQYPGRVVVIRSSSKYLEFRLVADDKPVTVVCANGRMVTVL